MPESTPEAVPVAIYTRVSTVKQVGGRFDSCAAQAEACRTYLRERERSGWVEVACYRDAAQSGATLIRPGLLALQQQIAAGEVKVVLIAKLERVMRSTDDWVPFQALLRKHGCRLESTTETLDETTPAGRLQTNLLVGVAEYERLNTAEKTRTKMLGMVQRGFWPGGYVPYGYERDPARKELRKHPEEAPVVQRVFAEAAQGVPLVTTADALNAEGRRTRQGVRHCADGEVQATGGYRFRADVLRAMLKNPIYRGTLVFGGQQYPGNHPPLVSTELWLSANRADQPDRRTKTLFQDRDINDHLLKGIARCGSCGSLFVPLDATKHAGKERVYRFYACQSYRRRSRPDACLPVRFSAPGLEKTVLAVLCEVGKRPDLVSAAWRQSGLDTTIPARGGRRSLGLVQRQLDGIALKLTECVEAVAKRGPAALPAVSARAAELRQLRERLLRQREELRQAVEHNSASRLTERQAHQAFRRFPEQLPGMVTAQLKEFVRQFVSRVDVEPRKIGVEDGVRTRVVALRIALSVPRLAQGWNRPAEQVTPGARYARPENKTLDLRATVDFSNCRNAQAVVLTPVRMVVSLRPSRFGPGWPTGETRSSTGNLRTGVAGDAAPAPASQGWIRIGTPGRPPSSGAATGISM